MVRSRHRGVEHGLGTGTSGSRSAIPTIRAAFPRRSRTEDECPQADDSRASTLQERRDAAGDDRIKGDPTTARREGPLARSLDCKRRVDRNDGRRRDLDAHGGCRSPSRSWEGTSSRHLGRELQGPVPQRGERAGARMAQDLGRHAEGRHAPGEVDGNDGWPDLAGHGRGSDQGRQGGFHRFDQEELAPIGKFGEPHGEGSKPSPSR